MEYPIQELLPSAFPPLIAEITDPPKKLYVRGTLPSIESKWLCVVGSRKFSPYGRDACASLIEGLRGYPVVIVSGLALGIDGVAHEAALRANLPTIAVPGSGLADQVLYPSSHFPLAQKILKAGGALLSEFEPNWKPRPESFPQRNRIMAGLSHAVFVIEAEGKSGTLITSRLATEYNRDVLTIPHPIFSATGEGPHMLMRLGATPIRSTAEILEALDLDPKEKSIPINFDTDGPEIGVLKLLASPLPKDDLVRALNIPARDASVLLSAMELKGIIVEESGFIRKT